mgnify:CR=1 FL=1
MKATLRRMWGAWKEIGVAFGDFQARLILTLFYCGLFPIVGTAVRLFSDPLRRRRPRAGSWLRREKVDDGLQGIKRQF